MPRSPRQQRKVMMEMRRRGVLGRESWVHPGSKVNREFITGAVFHGNYKPEAHERAKQDILKLLKAGRTVQLYDGSGWQVTFLPPDGDEYYTSVGHGRSGGRYYLEANNAGMIPTWEWQVHAAKERTKEEREKYLVGSALASAFKGKFGTADLDPEFRRTGMFPKTY